MNRLFILRNNFVLLNKKNKKIFFKKIKYLKALENELSNRSISKEENKNSLDENDLMVQEILKSFRKIFSNLESYKTYKIDIFNNEKIKQNEEFNYLKEKNYRELLKLFQDNILKYGCIIKLNKELEYAREKLEYAMRTQQNLTNIRQRVDWLENEIETIILSNEYVIIQFRKIKNESK